MARRSKLNETRNFLDLYLHHVGRSDVPRAYHKWAALSLLAACVRNNVWYEKYADIKLSPHLLVWLIGESGTGKDLATRVALRYLKHAPVVRTYQGRASAQAFLDWLAKVPTGRTFQDCRAWLISTELANSVGTGGRADDWLKMATDIYSGKDPNIEWQESTRHAGTKKLVDPVLNWFAGTTRDWLTQVVTLEDIKGGFFARICPIEVVLDESKRIRRPTVPLDYLEVQAHLYERIEVYCNVEGVFQLSEEANVIDAQWYEQRPRPTDQRLMPTWRRQHEQVLKLAQLFALCDIENLSTPLLIEGSHLTAAQREVSKFLTTTQQLLAYAGTKNLDGQLIRLVAVTIKEAGAIRHSRLLRKVYAEGISSELLHRITQTLHIAGEVSIVTHEAQGMRATNPTYVWQRRRMPLIEPGPNEDEEEPEPAPGEHVLPSLIKPPDDHTEEELVYG